MSATEPTEVRKSSPLSFYGIGKYRWKVFPDYWKKDWGPRPFLGLVYADDEFYAVREAYNRGLLTMNYTFGPKVVNVGEAKRKPKRPQDRETREAPASN